MPIIEVDKKLTKYDDSIKTVIPTELGVNICRVLLDQNIADWNVPWLKFILMEDEKEIVPGIPYQSKFGFITVFANKNEKTKAEEFYKERKKVGFTPLYKFCCPYSRKVR